MDTEANLPHHVGQTQQQQQQRHGSRWSIASRASRILWDWCQDSGYRLLRFILCIVFLCILPAGYSDVRQILLKLADNTVLESNTNTVLEIFKNEMKRNNTAHFTNLNSTRLINPNSTAYME